MFMEFLYFPEDKSEYIPAFIMLVLIMILAIGTMYLFYKKSKKDEKMIDDFDVDQYRIDKHDDRKDN
ncbi:MULTISPECIES: hypothetical protein [unclassified Pseudogracilibacillus]|mgnify:CR=1 FL=1